MTAEQTPEPPRMNGPRASRSTIATGNASGSTVGGCAGETAFYALAPTTAPPAGKTLEHA